MLRLSTKPASTRGSTTLVSAVAGALFALLSYATTLQAAPVLGPWQPWFKGIDYSVSTNFPGTGDLRYLQVVHALRIDLTDPDVRMFTTPRIDNYVPESSETGGLTVSNFLLRYGLQAAINANYFGPGSYYLPSDTPMDVYGLAISEGTVVSEQTESRHAAVMAFDQQNQGRVIYTNWPANDTSGIYTAVAGDRALVVAGRNVVSRGGDAEPRTVFGLSEDRHYLYVLAIDGRQPGYSIGATDFESATWLILFGAYDGINVDGGGSTTLVVQDPAGDAVRLNSSSAVADSGRERTVGSHFGFYAKPLPGFINDVVAAPDERTANVHWTTIEPASSQVEYGPTRDLGLSSDLDDTLVTEHSMVLTNLAPNTTYYYRVLSAAAGQDHLSSIFAFKTTNYVTRTLAFGVTNAWTFSPGPFEDTAWTAPSFNDSGWSGPGAGLLWIDVRAAGPNADIEPKNTLLPVDTSTGFPYRTYYFRTHVDLPQLAEGSALAFKAYADDGLVVYLNGMEIERLRIPPGASSSTLASGYPCGGDATCADEFEVNGAQLSSVREGDNLIAVEVHNYDARSPDITFGLELTLVQPSGPPGPGQQPKLEVRFASGSLTLAWTETGYVLQSAASPEGPWSKVTTASPFVTTPSEAQQYFRLQK